jgi:uncharacterized repeat protein (TIGR01451 family)
MGIWAATVSAEPAPSPMLQTLPTRPAAPSRPTPQPPTAVPPSSKPAPQPPTAVPPPPEPTAASPFGSPPVELDPSTFQITFAELGYEEHVLNSPYGSTEYALRLPVGWELRDGSFVELDLSYRYSYGGAPETQVLPFFFGDIIVDVDGQTQGVFPITEAVLEHFHLRVDLPPSLLNDPAQRAHTVRVFLDAGHICEVPHRASLVIHPSSLFSLSYDQLPITADLALYPSPFYQRAFEPDQVRFVLPASPAEEELAGAVAIAAKMGDLTSGMVISGTTDLELIARLEALKAGETLHEHLIVVGRPETNEMVLRLNRLGALPVPLRERQLSLASEGPAAVASGGALTYTLTLTNTTQQAISSLSLVDTLPAYTRLVTCSPPCTEGTNGREVSWSVSSLEPGEALNYTLELRLSGAITDSVVENTVTLFDATSAPLNVNTLTTAVRSVALPESGLASSDSSRSRYFFVAGERAVPENDGVVQEIVSPWDQTRAILVVTGLGGEAVYKASHAMSFESHFPGIGGSFALVREVRPLPELPPEPQATDLAFADLGYGDRVLAGSSQDVSYVFDIPLGWTLSQEAYLDLRFSHSQLLDYGRSFVSVSFNNRPVAAVALSDETALNGELRVELPPSGARPGQRNRISIQSTTCSADPCAGLDTWLVISSASQLHLDHEERDAPAVDLGLYPDPLDRRSDLADVLFVLPPEPRPGEWEPALQLAAALGSATGGTDLKPGVALGDTRPEAQLADYHLIAMGRPSRNPVLRQVNVQLPQPFQPDSDAIEQQIDGVVFRLPPGLSLGFIQLIPSPWNEARVFLAVTGTTDEGVKGAVDVLANRSWVLSGDLALIKDAEVSTMDTRGLTSSGAAMSLATAVPEMTPVGTATATAEPTASSPKPGGFAAEPTPRAAGRPAWLIPLVGVNGLLVLGILAFAVWRARQ